MIRLKQGNDKRALGLLSEAKSFYLDYLKDYPKDAVALANLGNIYRDQGIPSRAIECYRLSLDSDPCLHWVHSNLLMTLNYDEGHGLESLDRAANDFSKTLPPTDEFGFKNRKDPHKKIHLGFVSADFRWHSVSFFLFGLMKNLDPRRFELTCISENKEDDEMTNLLKEQVDGWLNTSGLSENQFVKTVRRCRIDVLVDLSGHTAYNRSVELARKCAPIQVSWLGYPTRTGNVSIDYWMTDPVISEGDLSRLSAIEGEQALVMEKGIHAYWPPVEESLLSEKSNREKESSVVLGCFNHRAKMTDVVLKLWADILNRLCQTQLYLKGRSFNDSEEISRVERFFDKNGVDRHRLRIEGRSTSTIDHLNCYRDVDIALDTFPYNGTTTTCEALWMGVPVVTLKGETHASRVSASLLTQMGKKDWIADSPNAYLEAVRHLVSDEEYRRQFLATSKTEMYDCGLTDSKRFAEEFGGKIAEVWDNYCFSI